MSQLSPFRAVLVTAVASALLAVVAAAPASAAFDTYMGVQGLSAGNAYASASAHTNISSSGADVDHTACPGYGLGWGGYTSTPFSGGNSMTYAVCGYTQGNQTVFWHNVNGPSSSRHGAVYNPNSTTYDNFTWAIYYW
ncbi:hypothetical protein C8N24_5569 [Solirubrobacter pauli]|uniref:Lactococcin 972 family bacteriocin n=1 Tax=Solirubrobacter pauli TaxID=166793 RepID=A0A660L2U7_9ACTN|nr:hypothetical protein [Solirubrobacter pauli]RKQ87544.1 hypothetical protein C8N24_5569 [Solirubrobacter pauli]